MNREFNQSNNNFNIPNMQCNAEEYMYPEIYRHFAPIADRLIQEMEIRHGEIYLTEELLNDMVEEAIRRSGIDNQQNMPADPYDDMDMPDEDAMPVMRDFRRGGSGRRRGYGRGGWRRYDRSAISDLYRILLLQQIFGRRRHSWRY